MTTFDQDQIRALETEVKWLRDELQKEGVVNATNALKVKIKALERQIAIHEACVLEWSEEWLNLAVVARELAQGVRSPGLSKGQLRARARVVMEFTKEIDEREVAADIVETIRTVKDDP